MSKKTNDLVEHISEWENARVSKGAKIMVPNSDARKILELLDKVCVEDRNEKAFSTLVNYLGNMATAVLESGLKKSSSEELVDRYLPKEDASSIVDKM